MMKDNIIRNIKKDYDIIYYSFCTINNFKNFNLILNVLILQNTLIYYLNNEKSITPC